MRSTWDVPLFIDGEWTDQGVDESIEVIDPATEAPIGSVAQATVEHARAAVMAARRAFDSGPWPWMSPRDTGAIIERFACALDARRAELDELVIAETGSLPWLADMVQVGGAINVAHYNARAVEDLVEWSRSTPPVPTATGLSGDVLVREPVGVVAAITPFNFPFFINMVKVVPALAVGCTVVLKPHPWTPLNAMEIARAAAEAGMPPGVFNVVTGGADIGEELSSNPNVDMVSFTGSTATGRRIMNRASDTVKRLHLELGGKSARIVLDDLSDEQAGSLGMGACLVHSGQGCELQTRLILPTRLLGPFVEGVTAMMQGVVIGDPRTPGTQLGPLIRRQQVDRVDELVQSGVQQGADLLLGGRRPPHLDRGFYYEPTVFVNCRSDMRVCQEEIFGPVLTVLTYDTEAEAIALANDTIFGLSGGVVSNSTARAFNVARQIRSGKVGITTVGAAPLADLGPGNGTGPGWAAALQGAGISGAFGGYKQSGVGREWGRSGLEEFTQLKWINWS